VLKQLKEQSRWLLTHAGNVTSQFGEDGIISAALDLIPDRTSWCVEFGAWDGRMCSNTYSLTSSRDYRGVFIEGDPERFQDLQRTYSGNKHVLLNTFVGFGENDCLDSLLSKYSEIPTDFDILSIDIDGNDYHVWNAVKRYRPKLVIVEYNPTAANSVHFVQRKDSGLTQGCSARSLVELGRTKGYELIAATTINLIFVEAKYFPLFHLLDNSLEVMRDDDGCPHIFVGYDGHVFLSEKDSEGTISLPWHRLQLRESKVQALPSNLQTYPDNYTFSQRVLFRTYLALHKRLGMKP
jgi:hypothetical protein